MTAWRIRIFTGGVAPFTAALRTNAWYALMLIALPARLGEAVAVMLFRRHLGLATGAALASVVVQRIYDLIILAAIFAVALAGLSGALPRGFLLMAGLVVLGLSIVVLMQLDALFTIAATQLRQRPRMRPLLRVTLQARLWHRHRMVGDAVPAAVVATMAKWTCNLGALAVLVLATAVGLGVVDSVVVAAAFNFLAIVPLQTVGGFGLGEAGIMVLLGAFAVPLAIAAPVGIVIRAVLIGTTVLFWGLVMAGLKLRGEQT